MATLTEPAAAQAAPDRSAEDVLRHARSYAREGFYVLPWHVEVNDSGKVDKVPSVKAWEHGIEPPSAPPDPDQVEKWFGPGGRFEGSNIGIATGWRWMEGGPVLFAVEDVDGDTGADSWARLTADLQLTPEELNTWRARTQGGGTHHLFQTRRPVKNGTSWLHDYPKVDVRGIGGFIAVAPSTAQGRPYTWQKLDGSMLIMPEALEALQPRPSTEAKQVDRPGLDGVDPARAKVRAVEYLITKAPLAIEGQAGNQTTYKVAAQVKDFGCDQDQTTLLMDEFWNDRCTPPWSLADLQDLVAHSFKYGENPQGSAAPEAVFAPFVEPGQVDETPHPLDKMNRDHAFVLVGGTGQILWDTTDEHGQPITKLLGLPTFHQLHAAQVFQAGKKKTEQLTEAWMTWPQRRTFEKLCLAPGEDLPPRFYNLWRGFAVTSAPGDWSRMRAHIRDVICSGNASLDRYVMGWLALMVQKPGKRAEVALVLRGGKGVGKGILGNALCRIFGRHALHLVNAKHLVGNFNGHMRETVFIFADESFWAGDRQHESTLKGIITEPEFMLEAKGKDAEMWPNRLHLLMASNDEWVAPASVDERRFCVLDVSPVHQQDTQYFGALMDQMEAGGFAAMLHDLKAWDLKGFNVYDIPGTKALTDQKISSLRGPDRWLHEVLEEGAIFGHTWTNEPLAVPKADAYTHYCDRSRRLFMEHHPADGRVFWKKVRGAMLAGGLKIEDDRPTTKLGRVRLAVFPPLDAARGAFAKYLRGDVDWGEPITGPKLDMSIFG